MPEGGDREAYLTADYNAEMIEHIARLPRIRDRSIFVGEPDDIVPDDSVPGLPEIRAWTEEHFDFCGYITGLDPALERGRGHRVELRLWRGRENLHRHRRRFRCRRDLLRRVLAGYPRREGADPGAPHGRRGAGLGSTPALDGTRGSGGPAYVARALQASCGLRRGGRPGRAHARAWSWSRRSVRSCTSRSRDHFEQNFHVRHRLTRYGADRCLDIDAADPETIATAIEAAIAEPVSYRDVAPGGARRAAELIAELL